MMIKRLLAAAFATMLTSSVHAADWIITPYGEGVVAEMNSVLNYQSTWGLSTRRDLTESTGTGTVTLDGGFVSVASGATGGSTADLSTVDFGRYLPGRRAVIGIGVVPEAMPTGDGVIRIGGFTDTDGVFMTIRDSNGDGESDICFTYRSPNQSPNDQEVCGYNRFNGNPKPDDFDPMTEAFVFNIRFNWYGVGGAQFEFLYVDSSGAIGVDDSGLRPWIVHTIAPESGQAMQDPNFPIRVEVDNGTADENVEVKIGGRRFDIEGNIAGFERESGDYRLGQSVASGGGLIPTVCVRREAEFPPGSGRENTVRVQVVGFDVETTEDLIGYIVLDPGVTGGTWGIPTDHNDDETAIDSNTGATSIVTSNAAVTGPYYLSGGAAATKSALSTSRVNIQLASNEPVCLAVKNESGTGATVSSTMRVLENW